MSHGTLTIHFASGTVHKLKTTREAIDRICSAFAEDDSPDGIIQDHGSGLYALRSHVAGLFAESELPDDASPITLAIHFCGGSVHELELDEKTALDLCIRFGRGQLDQALVYNPDYPYCVSGPHLSGVFASRRGPCKPSVTPPDDASDADEGADDAALRKNFPNLRVHDSARARPAFSG
jgi:hypothetical protein